MSRWCQPPVAYHQPIRPGGAGENEREMKLGNEEPFNLNIESSGAPTGRSSSSPGQSPGD